MWYLQQLWWTWDALGCFSHRQTGMTWVNLHQYASVIRFKPAQTDADWSSYVKWGVRYWRCLYVSMGLKAYINIHTHSHNFFSTFRDVISWHFLCKTKLVYFYWPNSKLQQQHLKTNFKLYEHNFFWKLLILGIKKNIYMMYIFICIYFYIFLTHKLNKIFYTPC